MIVGYFSVSECTYCDDVTDRLFTKVRSTSYGTSTPFDRRTHNYRPVFLLLPNAAVELKEYVVWVRGHNTQKSWPGPKFLRVHFNDETIPTSIYRILVLNTNVGAPNKRLGTPNTLGVSLPNV